MMNNILAVYFSLCRRAVRCSSCSAMADNDEWFSDLNSLNLNGRQAHQVEGFYLQISERHKFVMRQLFSDDTFFDINFVMTDAMRVAARGLCRNPSAEWPEMHHYDHAWEAGRRNRELAIVQEWRGVEAPAYGP